VVLFGHVIAGGILRLAGITQVPQYILEMPGFLFVESG